MRRVQRRVITFSKTITSLCHTALNSITEYRNLDSLLVLSVRKRASVCVFAKHTHTHTQPVQELISGPNNDDILATE